MRSAVSTILVCAGLVCAGCLQQNQGRITQPAAEKIPARRARAKPTGRLERPSDKLGKARDIKDDPRYKEFSGQIESARRGLLLWEGDFVSGYPDCVAIGVTGPDGKVTYYATGTLVGENVVLTAGHVIKRADGQAMTILFASDVNDPNGNAYAVQDQVVHEGYKEYDDGTYPEVDYDIGILILTEKVKNVRPRALAPKAAMKSFKKITAVGFGLSRENPKELGKKRKGEVAVPSCDCTRTVNMVTDADAFGCHRLDEMVSVDFANPCYGDSGGPAYLSVNGDLYLAGVISRLTRRTAADKELCSGGCIYTRIDRFEDWIRRKAGEKGGHMPTPAATPADAAPGKGPP